MRKLNYLARPLARMVMVVGASLALLGLVGNAPANAVVSEIWAGAGVTITTDNRTSPPTTNVKFSYDVYVTVGSNLEAQQRIDGGGLVTAWCYGNNGRLFESKHTKHSAMPLTAHDNGILVKASFTQPKGGLFDTNKYGQDRLYCTVQYTDSFGPGYWWYATTNTVTGYF
ncbi:hypothetical protein [Kribbella deserti]|uniref:Uncharacterized protein n=1 Tax=Kribbella deserti TaxID=1926257 RepID=A0ABV6QN60_9ACTN